MRLRRNASSRSAVRRHVTRVLDDVLSEVEYAEPFNLEQFCAALAIKRKRAIHLLAMSVVLGNEQPPPFSGLWLGGGNADYLFYDDTTSQLHGQNIVLHELAHMLLGHRASGKVEDAHLRLLSLLMPDLDPEMLRRSVSPGLCRSRPTDRQDGFSELQEVQAEMLGTAMWERLSDTSQERNVTASLDENEALVISRLAENFGNTRRGPK